MIDIQPEAFSPREVVNLTKPKISERIVRRAIRLGEIPAYAVGRRQFVMRDNYLAWIKRERA